MQKDRWRIIRYDMWSEEEQNRPKHSSLYRVDKYTTVQKIKVHPCFSSLSKYN